MAEDITPPENYVAGESATWEFTITEDGSAKDITAASVSWWLLPRQGDATSEAVLDDGDSGVSASIVDAANGRVDVTIDQGATDGLGGAVYWQRLDIDDSGPGLQIWRGDWSIETP